VVPSQNMAPDSCLSPCPPHFVGLPNPNGDICYANSVIQALSHVLCLLGDLSWREPIKNGSCNVTSEAKSLFHIIESANISLRQPSTASAELEMPHVLPLLRALRAMSPGNFTPGQQHDAAQAYECIVDGFSQDTPLMSALFTGTSRWHTRCLACSVEGFR
jgi:hypothetical protein